MVWYFIDKTIIISNQRVSNLRSNKFRGPSEFPLNFVQKLAALTMIYLSTCLTPLQIKRGVRQGDPISPKLFSAAIETIFQTVDIDKGLNIDGETLRFADDISLTTNNMTEWKNSLTD